MQRQLSLLDGALERFDAGFQLGKFDMSENTFDFELGLQPRDRLAICPFLLPSRRTHEHWSRPRIGLCERHSRIGED
jgi:hypothetical protein